HGVTPELVPDFYGLKGDSSDNIPGVPGIGPKKAAQLIREYGSLDEVIAHADEVKGKMGENLRAHIDDALVSRKVATIRTDAPVEVNLLDSKFPTFDAQEVVDAFSALGFTGMISRLVRLGGGDVPAPAAPDPTIEVPAPLESDAALEALARAIADGEWVAAEMQGVKQKKGQQSLFDEVPPKVLWAAVGEGLLRLEGDDVVCQALVDLVRAGRLVSADVKALIHEVYPVDSSVPALIAETDLDPTRLFDVSVAGYLLDSDSGVFSAAQLYQNPAILGGQLPEETDDVPQAAIDVLAELALRPALEEKLTADGSEKLFYELEMPLSVVLLEMERTGLHADPERLAEQSAELGAEMEGMVDAIHGQAGEKFNLDSPQQLSHVLFDVLGLPTFGLKKTRKGFYSTNAKVLGDLAKDHKIVADVLEYRERAKIKSTYLDALPALIRADGRIHTTLNQTVAATGRLSSSDPNLQNIPTRSELGHRVRTAFTVPEGSVFLACDYSQIELRLLAHLSEDEHLIAAFREGADFHAATAARVFGVPVEEVTPALRSRAKAVNFGIVYGQQAYGLATSLKIPRAEAQEMIDRYFEAYPGVRAYLDSSIEFARRTGYATTMYGRKRHIKDIKASNFQLRSFAERTAMNHPMQGTAADIIKFAMIRVPERMRAEGLKSKLVLQIHDELDFEVPEGEVEALSELVRETMEGVCELRVPLLADVSYGSNWAEAK
ncbi:MAG: DNA polymerase I, partial [Olsenella sp.]|nr:DNA polymerase I [Olsenella sp.]